MATVEAIHLCAEAGEPLHAVDEVKAVAGVGLYGDRYAVGGGTWSKRFPGVHRHVTLIESEALEALRRDHDIELSAAESRRNILTSGVALNHLVGREFRVGDVVLRGIELCEPCRYLEKVTGRPVRAPLVHRGGLNAEVVEGGVIRVGDAVTPV